MARQTIMSADAITDRMLDVILADRGYGDGTRVALLVNNLGGTTTMELAVVARRALARLRERGLLVERAWAGTLLSALEMPGCSLSLMKLDDDRLALLDRPTEAPAWAGPGMLPGSATIVPTAGAPAESEVLVSADAVGETVRRGALAAAAALEAAEPRLTELDSLAGDGDLGISMKRAADAIRKSFADGNAPDAASNLALLAGTLRRAIGGSSGPFYAVGLLRAARQLADEPESDLKSWAAAFSAGVAAISELGGARSGDRTMLDALLPAAEALAAAARDGLAPAEAWAQAAEAARKGADATSGMRPRLGRASYLGDRALGAPDGGAVAVAIWLAAVSGR